VEKLLKVKDLAEIFNLSEDRIYSLSREGLIKSVRLGRTLRFDPSAISEFISSGGKELPRE
jgi:excisionase family DNA binding protein